MTRRTGKVITDVQPSSNHEIHYEPSHVTKEYMDKLISTETGTIKKTLGNNSTTAVKLRIQYLEACIKAGVCPNMNVSRARQTLTNLREQL